MEDPRLIPSALGHQKMQMGMEIYSIPEGLDDGDNAGLKHRPRHGLKIEEKRPDRIPTKVSEELALELEEEAQHFGDDQDHLTVRDIEEERLPHPLPHSSSLLA